MISVGGGSGAHCSIDGWVDWTTRVVSKKRPHSVKFGKENNLKFKFLF